MKNRLFLLFLLMAPLVSLYGQQKLTVSGFVYDSLSGEKLLGAEIYHPASRKGTVSNEYGFYSLTLPYTDTISLQVRYLGYREKNIRLKATGPSVHKDIYLIPGESLEAVVIEGATLERPEKQASMGQISLRPTELQSVPVIMAEPDPIKVLHKLPGIQGTTEGMSGLVVRGGNPDQNLYLLDDVPLYYIYHLGGFVSSFNPDAINQLTIYKGDFPARYGNRLSSILDVRTRDGNKKAMHGRAMISLISWKLSLEGPLVKNRTSYFVSVRRLPYDLLVKGVSYLSTDGEDYGGYTFYDINVKLNHHLSDRDQISASLYTGDDVFGFTSRYDGEKEKVHLGWGNQMGALKWSRRWSDRWFNHSVLSYTRYRLVNRLGAWEGKRKLYFLKYYSGITDWAFRSDWQYIPSAEHDLRLGGGITHHTFRPGVLDLEGEWVDETPDFPRFVYQAWEPFVYAEWEARWNRRFSSRLGFHLAGYRAGKKYFLSPEPRLSFNYRLGEYTSLKASYSIMHQSVHLLTSSGMGLPVDLWMPATEKVPPSHARIIAVGAARSDRAGKWFASAELYYKNMTNLIHYKPGASFLSTAIKDWETLVETGGTGTSYGLEFLWKKTSGRLTGWIGYTWSKSMRHFQNLNKGRPFPFRYDRRHKIDITGNYRLNDHVLFSASWTFSTGTPVTLPLGYAPIPQWPAYEDGIYSIRFYQVYSDRGQFRMRPYHRLDLGWQFKKQKKHGERTWIISIYNAYNRQNPLFYVVSSMDPATGREDPGVYQLSLFPIIPSVGYVYKF